MHPLIVLAAALIFVALLVILWRQYARRRERALNELQRRRYAELKRELLTIGQPVAIRGATGIVATALVTLIAAGTGWIWLLDGGAVFLLTALLCTVIAVLGLWQSLPKLGRPLLILSRQEIDIAGLGPLPWSAIEGIELSEVRHRDSVVAHSLRLYVPDLQQRLAAAHPWVRLWYRLTRRRRWGRIASLRLRATSEAPATIERLCRDLWKAATDRDHPWSIHNSNAELEVISQVHRLRDNDPLRDPEAELTALRALSARLDTVQAESVSRLRMQHVGTVAVAVILVLLVTQQIVGLFTNFVGSEAWLAISLGIAVVLGLIGVAVIAPRLRMGASVVVALLIGFVVAVSVTWLLIQESIGDPVARNAGRAEVITVVAKKTDRVRRRGCSKRLQGGGVGNPICLSEEEFAQLPDRVKVTLRVRRHWIGYHVDSQQIEQSR